MGVKMEHLRLILGDIPFSQTTRLKLGDVHEITLPSYFYVCIPREGRRKIGNWGKFRGRSDMSPEEKTNRREPVDTNADQARGLQV